MKLPEEVYAVYTNSLFGSGLTSDIAEAIVRDCAAVCLAEVDNWGHEHTHAAGRMAAAKCRREILSRYGLTEET